MPPPIPTQAILKSHCPRCGEILEFHQPDPMRPKRLLGACRCGEWFMVEGGLLFRVQRPDAS